MIVMYDTVTPRAIPSLANTSRDAVAGYANGTFTDTAQMFAAFPLAHHLSITPTAGRIADCLDIETGDASPGQAPGWYRAAKAAGIWRPCLYANLSTMPAVAGAMDAAGIPRADYRLWAAHFTNTPHLEAGSDATQWTDHGPHGENYDESLCLDSFFPAPPAVVIPAGVAHADLRFDLHDGRWDVHSSPGDIHLDPHHDRWASVEVQFNVHNGHWRCKPMRWNSRPLGRR